MVMKKWQHNDNVDDRCLGDVHDFSFLFFLSLILQSYCNNFAITVINFSADINTQLFIHQQNASRVKLHSISCTGMVALNSETLKQEVGSPNCSGVLLSGQKAYC